MKVVGSIATASFLCAPACQGDRRCCHRATPTTCPELEPAWSSTGRVSRGEWSCRHRSGWRHAGSSLRDRHTASCCYEVTDQVVAHRTRALADPSGDRMGSSLAPRRHGGLLVRRVRSHGRSLPRPALPARRGNHGGGGNRRSVLGCATPWTRPRCRLGRSRCETPAGWPNQSRCRCRRGRGRDSEDRGTFSNTTQCLRVVVHYRFHPLHGLDVKAVAVPRTKDGVVTVEHPPGDRLKIPRWMLSPAAAEMTLSAQASVSLPALLALVELLGGVFQQCDRGSADPDGYHATSLSDGSAMEGSDEAAGIRLRKPAGRGKRGSARSGDTGTASRVDRGGHSDGRRRSSGSAGRAKR